MESRNLAPKTVNRRVCSLSSFYKYLGGAAGEMRLPITTTLTGPWRSEATPERETRRQDSSWRTPYHTLERVTPRDLILPLLNRVD